MVTPNLKRLTKPHFRITWARPFPGDPYAILIPVNYLAKLEQDKRTKDAIDRILEIQGNPKQFTQ